MNNLRPVIIFFNHYHRGDLFTSKEFVRQIKNEYPDAKLEYWHFNHPKVIKDLNIDLTNAPSVLQTNAQFYKTTVPNVLLVNTWIGAWGDIFSKCGGVNLQSLTESWKHIYENINSYFDFSLSIKENHLEYLPRIDYSFFNVAKIDEFLNNNQNKKVLICNGKPMSNQSFDSDMESDILALALRYPDVGFICTKKFLSFLPNILFTEDIIQDTEEYSLQPFWVDMQKNICDLNEISYLSTHCDVIIGKNSGPFVFCETFDNLMDPRKTIVSFSRGATESMSNCIEKKCNYKLVTDHSEDNISNVLFETVAELKQ